MKAAGVPIVPGSDGLIESEDHLRQVANDIGYPIIIKATAGGGGKGMRVVEEESELIMRIKWHQMKPVPHLKMALCMLKSL